MLKFFNDDTIAKVDDLPFNPNDEINSDTEPYHPKGLVEVLEDKYGDLLKKNIYDELDPWSKKAKKKLAVKRIIEKMQYIADVFQFAKESELLDNLRDKLKFLEDYGQQKTTTTLNQDFAKYSFTYNIYDKNGDVWLHGGLIFHPKHKDGEKIWGEGEWSLHS